MQAEQYFDPFFQVEVLSATPNPQLTCWLAAHNDYSETFICDESEKEKWPNEERAGVLILNNLLKGDRGHWGPLEHAQIVFAVGNFPHSVVMQHRTHRIASFDVQSQRYTGERIVKASKGDLSIEEVCYYRPVGEYSDRNGKKYNYSEYRRDMDKRFDKQACQYYADLLAAGFAEEHARDRLPQGIRQNYVVSMNARSFLHFMDIRAKRDAQLEIQQLADMMWPHFQQWMPAVATYYADKRLHKARLAP